MKDTQESWRLAEEKEEQLKKVRKATNCVERVGHRYTIQRRVDEKPKPTTSPHSESKSMATFLFYYFQFK